MLVRQDHDMKGRMLSSISTSGTQQPQHQIEWRTYQYTSSQSKRKSRNGHCVNAKTAKNRNGRIEKTNLQQRKSDARRRFGQPGCLRMTRMTVFRLGHHRMFQYLASSMDPGYELGRGLHWTICNGHRWQSRLQ